MKTKFTLKKYNDILSEHGIKCIPEVKMSDGDIISKRKKYNHYCYVCGQDFKITPSKLLKSQTCIYDHTNNLIEEDIKILNEVPEIENIPVQVPTYKEPNLSIQQYIKNLPIYIKHLDSIRSIRYPIDHMCNKCKHHFTITPRTFHECHYKCPNCQ